MLAFQFEKSDPVVSCREMVSAASSVIVDLWCFSFSFCIQFSDSASLIIWIIVVEGRGVGGRADRQTSRQTGGQADRQAGQLVDEESCRRNSGPIHVQPGLLLAPRAGGSKGGSGGGAAPHPEHPPQVRLAVCASRRGHEGRAASGDMSRSTNFPACQPGTSARNHHQSAPDRRADAWRRLTAAGGKVNDRSARM